ncbi:uncharacterized protein BP01DRAFT_323383 [Aspergillus saccharolyticus JOP 1030-1]|uniref:Uncharacterized protein n=1 Tax=Aspergillus saccharolyticus JOP 1030-1 TaxID=1450539 RepID=A0A318Z7Q3_9EURO|nr:hypothetical protein BP01DRAFT_323383 [Aspergillus saccharolyticus JOP 1030-1]PYH43335.1 hypothetical protein BP01DRAFT_323383 [Aspergillus saccharolyticus JOP 1030-1]
MGKEDSSDSARESNETSRSFHYSSNSTPDSGGRFSHMANEKIIVENGGSAQTTHDSDASSETSDSTFSYSPGDGICPADSQFNLCYQSKFTEWKNAAAARVPGSDTLGFYIRSLLGLLKDVPPFFHAPPEEVVANLHTCYLMSTICIQSTKDQACDQPQNSIEYCQFISSRSFDICKTSAETRPEIAIPISASPLRPGYLTSIILAWSYIFSARWVEILQQAGVDCKMYHQGNMQLEKSFWEIILQGNWEALFEIESEEDEERTKRYSPWMLRLVSNAAHGGDWGAVAPTSFMAFNILLEFCISEGLEGELLTALVAVINTKTPETPWPEYPPPIMISTKSSCLPTTHKDTIFHELFQAVDKLMTLGSTRCARDSLICSAFFDPSIPCNLIGGASLGVAKALSPVDEKYDLQPPPAQSSMWRRPRPQIPWDKIDKRQLLQAITYLKPHLSLFWAAAVHNNQATRFLQVSLGELPVICLPAACWTNTTQSFLQVAYSSSHWKEPLCTRVAEFQTSQFCRPDCQIQMLPWPRSPAPPFGSTPITNLSLEVREHLGHMHRPLSWQIYWKLKAGQRVPASDAHHCHYQEAHEVDDCRSAKNADESPHRERILVEWQSYRATSCLFDWHRFHEGGIWLDDGINDIDSVRLMQVHPWIKGWVEDGSDTEDTEPKELDYESILRWVDDTVDDSSAM